MVSWPGRADEKQNCPVVPFASVVPEPLAGVAPVAGEVGTAKTTLAFGTGLPNASRTVAVTQCVSPTVLVSAGGSMVTDAAGPGRTMTCSLPQTLSDELLN